jgi:CDP-paratose 2-epimerase
VRDLLHVDVAVELIDRVAVDPQRFDGLVANAGGGVQGSLSLRETTALCEEITGRSGLVTPSDEERPGDVPYYATDARHVGEVVGWKPTIGPRQILESIFEWAAANEAAVRTAL